MVLIRNIVALLPILAVSLSAPTFVSKGKFPPELVQTYLLDNAGLGLVAADLPAELNFTIEVYKVNYMSDLIASPNPEIPTVELSGLVMLPMEMGGAELDIYAMMHETILKADMVPSNAFEKGFPEFGMGGYAIAGGMLAAAVGNAVVIPDYIGLGGSNQTLQLTMMQDSYAAATFNLIKALEEEIDTLLPKTTLSETLRSGGYDEGAVAAMALHIQSHLGRWTESKVKSVEVTAAGGQYDLGNSQLRISLQQLEDQTDPDLADTAFIAYTFGVGLGYEKIFNQTYEKNIINILKRLYNGDYTYDEVSEELAKLPLFDDLISQEVMDAVFGNGTSLYVSRLRNETVADDLVPDSGMINVCHGEMDQVFYIENLYAVAQALRQGSDQNRSYDVLEESVCTTHENCKGPCFKGLSRVLAGKSQAVPSSQTPWYKKTEYIVIMGIGALIVIFLVMYCIGKTCCSSKRKDYDAV